MNNITVTKPDKPVRDMTPEELKAFRTSLPCDDMGFEVEDYLKKEGVVENA